MKDKDKIRFAVRVFLCANKGKMFTSKQISDFCNEFGFGGRSGCTSANIGRIMNKYWLDRVGISRDRKSSRHVWYYGVI